MPTVFFYLPVVLGFTLVTIYIERKIAAFIQDRLGPTAVGYKGFLQSLADMLKLLQKEWIIPARADRKLFILAPILVLMTVFAGFAVLPITSYYAGAPTQIGLLYILAMIALKILSILIAGWSSHNKYARLGALRAAAQMLAYEVPFMLSILCVVIVTRQLDLQAIAFQQGIGTTDQPSYFLGIPQLACHHWGGIFMWNIFRMPTLIFAYMLFWITSLAAANRAPFDLAEAESELVGGYHTEYSGLLWAFFMLAEYGTMFLLSLLGVILFLGGWHTPFPNIGFLRLADWTSAAPHTWIGNLWAAFWLFSKAMLIVFTQIWVKWSLPRLRMDQLMHLCWLYFVPIALILVLVTLWWQLFIL